MSSSAQDSSLVDRLHSDLLKRRPKEAAEILERVEVATAANIIATNQTSIISPVIERISPASWSSLSSSLSLEKKLDIFNKLAPGRAAAHLRVLDENARAELIDGLSPNQRADVELILSCAPDTAGAVMDPNVVYLRPNLTVEESLQRLRDQKKYELHARARRVLFVVDDANKLQGIVAIQDLALGDSNHLVSEYIQPIPAVISISARIGEIVQTLEEHRLSSLPVLDDNGHLVGVVRYEELVDVAKQGASVNMQTMFGVSRDEKALSPTMFAVSKRLPWLQINLLTAFLAAGVVGIFESTIASYTALAILLPVVAGQSGNTGAQALAVIIRGLALREISIAHWRKAMFKEASVGLINGIAVAATTSAGVYLWSRSLGLTCVIALSMVISMVVAGIAGASIPLLLTKLGQDPAQSSSIVLTTVTDIAGFFSFLGIATLFLAYL